MRGPEQEQGGSERTWTRAELEQGRSREKAGHEQKQGREALYNPMDRNIVSMEDINK